MRLPSRRFPLALLLALALCSCAGGPQTAAETRAARTAPAWLDDVTAISAHPGSRERRDTIRQLLQVSAIDAGESAFIAKDLQGANLLAQVAGDPAKPLLLLGAHLDQVDTGNGVTDNASGSAVVLALARRFRERPLQHHRVAAAFWDLEEKGLLGAHAYVTGGGEKPALYVNFDVFGWGDTLWMMSPDPQHPLVAASDNAAQAQGLRLTSGKQYPPTDHLAFLRAGWPAVSYSLVGEAETTAIVQVFSGGKPAAMPKVMEVIHSERDTLAEVDAGAVETGIDAVEAALRAWDAGHGG